jgi:hypothetical protein
MMLDVPQKQKKMMPLPLLLVILWLIMIVRDMVEMIIIKNYTASEEEAHKFLLVSFGANARRMNYGKW